MDTLSISFVVHEVIYVPYTYIHKDICYSGKFSAYLDVHLVHIYIYNSRKHQDTLSDVIVRTRSSR